VQKVVNDRNENITANDRNCVFDAMIVMGCPPAK
jgi:hypothetical protein